MLDIITEIIINKNIDEVANYTANPDHAPNWYDNIESVEWKTPKPLEIGSRLAFVANFLGRKLSYTYEIVEFIPLKRMIMKTSEGPLLMETIYTWYVWDLDHTKMTLQNRVKPKGFYIFMAPFLESMMKTANKKDLVKIKRIIEAM